MLGVREFFVWWLSNASCVCAALSGELRREIDGELTERHLPRQPRRDVGIGGGVPGSNLAQSAEDETAFLSTRSTWGPRRALDPKHADNRACPKNPDAQAQLQTAKPRENLQKTCTRTQAQVLHTQVGTCSKMNSSNNTSSAPQTEATHQTDPHTLLPYSFDLSHLPPLLPFFLFACSFPFPLFFLTFLSSPRWRRRVPPTCNITDPNTPRPVRVPSEHPSQISMHATHKPITRARHMSHMHHRAPRSGLKLMQHAVHGALHVRCWSRDAGLRMPDTHMPKLAGYCTLQATCQMLYTLGCTCVSSPRDACCKPKLMQHATRYKWCKSPPRPMQNKLHLSPNIAPESRRVSQAFVFWNYVMLNPTQLQTTFSCPCRLSPAPDTAMSNAATAPAVTPCPATERAKEIATQPRRLTGAFMDVDKEQQEQETITTQADATRLTTDTTGTDTGATATAAVGMEEAYEISASQEMKKRPATSPPKKLVIFTYQDIKETRDIPEPEDCATTTMQITVNDLGPYDIGNKHLAFGLQENDDLAAYLGKMMHRVVLHGAQLSEDLIDVGAVGQSHTTPLDNTILQTHLLAGKSCGKNGIIVRYKIATVGESSCHPSDFMYGSNTFEYVGLNGLKASIKIMQNPLYAFAAKRANDVVTRLSFIGYKGADSKITDAHNTLEFALVKLECDMKNQGLDARLNTNIKGQFFALFAAIKTEATKDSTAENTKAAARDIFEQFKLDNALTLNDWVFNNSPSGIQQLMPSTTKAADKLDKHDLKFIISITVDSSKGFTFKIHCPDGCSKNAVEFYKTHARAFCTMRKLNSQFMIMYHCTDKHNPVDVNAMYTALLDKAKGAEVQLRALSGQDVQHLKKKVRPSYHACYCAQLTPGSPPPTACPPCRRRRRLRRHAKTPNAPVTKQQQTRAQASSLPAPSRTTLPLWPPFAERTRSFTTLPRLVSAPKMPMSWHHRSNARPNWRRTMPQSPPTTARRINSAQSSTAPYHHRPHDH